MKITSKGQLTVPKKLRQKFGLTPSTEIDVVEEGNALRIVKKGRASSAVDRLYGILKQPASTDRLIERIRGQK